MPDEHPSLEDTVDPVPPVVWWLVLLLAAVVVAAVFWALPQTRDDLTAKGQQAVAAAGFGDVEVDFAGRDAVLSGSVPTPGDLAAVENVVARLEGVRTVDVAGVTVLSETDGGGA